MMHIILFLNMIVDFSTVQNEICRRLEILFWWWSNICLKQKLPNMCIKRQFTLKLVTKVIKWPLLFLLVQHYTQQAFCHRIQHLTNIRFATCWERGGTHLLKPWIPVRVQGPTKSNQLKLSLLRFERISTGLARSYYNFMHLWQQFLLCYKIRIALRHVSLKESRTTYTMLVSATETR